jgi:signal recognition particle subunit SRP54
MGDILTLIDKAQAEFDETKAKELEKKIKKAEFDFNDFLEQMNQVKKMGGLTDLLGMLPGMGRQLKDVEIDESALTTTEAIIYSMTKEERSNPDILNLSRKKRIAAGAGVDISQVNALVKQFEQSKKMMKQFSGMMGGKGGKRGKFRLPFGF